MPEKKLKELSYHTFEECKKPTDLNAKLKNQAKNAPPDKLYERYVSRMYDEALLYERDGDEEKAYIYFSRCCEFSQVLLNHKDFKSALPSFKKNKLKEIFNHAVSQLEQLQTSLKRRYELQAEIDEAAKKESEEFEQIQEKTKIGRDGEGTASKRPNFDEFSGRPTIKSMELYHLLTSKSRQLSFLVLDFREDNERIEVFNCEPGTETSINVVHIPQNLLKPGCIGSRLEKSLPMADRTIFHRRFEVDFVILFDSMSNELIVTKAKKSSPLSVLIDAIDIYDSRPLKRPPLVLDGGFESWKLHYPMHTTRTADFDAKQQSRIEKQFPLEFTGVPVSYAELEKLLEQGQQQIDITSTDLIEETETQPEPQIQRHVVVPEPETKIETHLGPSRLPPVIPVIPDRKLKPNEIMEKNEVPEVTNDPSLNGTQSDSSASVSNISMAEEESVVSVVENVEPSIEKVSISEAKEEELSKPAESEPIIPAKPVIDRNLKPKSEPQDEVLDRLDQAVLDHIGLKNESANFGEKLRQFQNDISHVDHSPSSDVSEKKGTVPVSTVNHPVIDRSNKPLVQLNKSSAFCADIRKDIELVISSFQGDPSRTGRQSVFGLTGLRNQGNWCFVNACLQPLSNIPHLRDYFRKQEFISYLNVDNKMGTKGIIACAFSALQLVLWSGTFRCVDPRPIIYRVSRYVNGMFGDGRQHDAQEFLCALLDALHEDVNQITDPLVTEQNNDNKTLVLAGREAWVNAQRFGSSKIYRLLQGQNVSILVCNICGKHSTTFDTFTQLTVDLPAKSQCTVEDCLSVHFRKEQMRGDAQWKCPKCDKLRDATKTMMLWKLPPILIIHLKRFEQIGATYRKKDTAVDFPLLSLNLNEFIHQNSDYKPEPYMLFAVTNHNGAHDHGHYTAFCRNPAKGSWFRYDDEDVTPIGEDNVRTRSAYILYYTRINWFRTR